MQSCHAHIQTHKPERLMTRLCKHWGHKFEVSLTEHSGEIALPMGTCRLHCPGAGLAVELQGESATMARFSRLWLTTCNAWPVVTNLSSTGNVESDRRTRSTKT